MPLSDTAIRSAKPRPRPYKLSDGGGLYLLVAPTGAKLWRLAYRFAGRQKGLALGAYCTAGTPSETLVGLAEARSRREAARRLLADGVDPAESRRQEKQAAAAPTFREVAADWLTRKVKGERKAPGTVERAEWLVRELSTALGSRPIAEIEPPELLEVLRRIEARGHLETVARMRNTASRVFRFGIASGLCGRDPAADLRGALTSPTSDHRAAITDATGVGALLRAIDGYSGQAVTRLALHFMILTMVRPGEARYAEWPEIDGSVWSIPAAKMKRRLPHRVPLSRQALAVLKELRVLTGNGRLLFPSTVSRDRPISENTLTTALLRLGYQRSEVSAHGMRSTASTILNESGLWSPDAIERQLAHVPRDKVRAAYHRGEHWPERVNMVQWYADHLDELRSNRKVVAFRHTAAAAEA
ncbi:tyrosine-type recombinase/integrase [Rhodoplanes sp. SY1]|uniref:tyrosine-type recombinase/integrase n=1 Tax=Rhodoplanes sp. SY1 TaxID=3166646 RepID=UPI0038B41E09